MMENAKERHTSFLQRRKTVLQAPELVSAPPTALPGKKHRDPYPAQQPTGTDPGVFSDMFSRRNAGPSALSQHR